MNKMKLSNNLRTLMNIKGWSEETLESRSGVSQSTINRILNATQDSPRLNTLLKIATSLGTTLAELTGEESVSEHHIRETKATYEAGNGLIRNTIRLIEESTLEEEDHLILNELIKRLSEKNQIK